MGTNLFDNKPYSTITSCRICGNQNLDLVTNLGIQNLSGIFPESTSEQPIRSPLEVIKCNNSDNRKFCGLVQLKHTAEVSSMYGETYGYRSSVSPTMRSHLKGIADFMVDLTKPNEGEIVLDIGCNDGTLLNNINEHNLQRIGIDPSSSKFLDNFDKDIEIICEYFSEGVFTSNFGHKKCKIITAIAMFYDLHDPIKFLNQITTILENDGVIALEFSYMPLMLKNLTYDQICHEHLTYLSLTQIKWMAESVGLKIINTSFNLINGGSIFVCLANKNSKYDPDTKLIQSVLNDEEAYKDIKLFQQFNRRICSNRDDLKQILYILNDSNKKIYGYGASTKGNIVLNFCGFNSDNLEAIFDASPEKHKRFTPGSNIPIISKKELHDLNPDYLLILIWHFRKEVLVDEAKYFLSGGNGIFPLPRMHFVSKNNYQDLLNSEVEDYGFSI